MRSGSIVRAGRLGFQACLSLAGEVYERRQHVQLGHPDMPPARAPGAAELTLLDARVASVHVPSQTRVVVLDIEAVSIAPGHLAAFLVGAAAWTGEELEVHQWLLADLAAEAALLDAVSALVRGSLLLTYNGRAFDMRVLGSRCVANGIHPAAMEPRVHVDLLAPARRAFRALGAGCALQQLEATVLGIDRGEDVAGSEGPARYRAWMRGAPADVLRPVVRHNLLDVTGTAALAARLVSDWQMLASASPGGRPGAPSQRSVR